MKVLLDTHILLWWLGDSVALPFEARDLIANPANTVFISAATMWEIRIKQRLGKLDAPDDLQTWVRNEEFEFVPISANHADATMQLPLLHRDPFDRMLVAQAKCLGLTLVTADPTVASYGSPVLHVK